MVGTGGSVDCLGYFDGPGHGLDRKESLQKPSTFRFTTVGSSSKHAHHRRRRISLLRGYCDHIERLSQQDRHVVDNRRIRGIRAAFVGNGRCLFSWPSPGVGGGAELRWADWSTGISQVGRSPSSKIRTDNEVVSVRDAVWRRRTHFSHAYRTSGVRSPATLPRAARCDRRRNAADPSSNGRRQPSVSLELVWTQGRLKGRTDESSHTHLG